MSENSRELRLARSRLRAAIKHLRNAVGLTCMAEDTRAQVNFLALTLEQNGVEAITKSAVLADLHLETLVRSRRGR